MSTMASSFSSRGPSKSFILAFVHSSWDCLVKKIGGLRGGAGGGSRVELRDKTPKTRRGAFLEAMLGGLMMRGVGS